MTYITPDHQDHKDLESSFQAWLETKKFLCGEQTYHRDGAGEAFVQRLRGMYTPQTMFLRGKADRTAIRERCKIVFLWEAKTHTNEDLHDWCIEAAPLAAHFECYRGMSKLDCLYVFHNPMKDYKASFWCSHPPPFRQIFFPLRDENIALKPWYYDLFKEHFPGLPSPTEIRPRPGPSNDPFVVIDESIVKQLPDGKTLVRELIKKTEKEFQDNILIALGMKDKT